MLQKQGYMHEYFIATQQSISVKLSFVPTISGENE